MPAKDAVLITPYRDGPLLIRGSFALADPEGNLIGCRRNPVALCRCGKSRMRPFCDGTHRLVSFRAPSTREDPWPQDEGSEEAAKAAPVERPAPRTTNCRTRTPPAVAALRRARARAGELEHRTE